MRKPLPKAPSDKVALYERVIATLPDVERKGAANPYTAVGGNMFTILSPEGVMAMRLAPADREAFLSAHGTRLYEAHGVVMREYVRVPDDLLADTERLRPLLAASYAYARSLRAKPTTRAKKNAG